LEAQLRHLFLLLAMAIALSGCGSSSATPSPTSVATASYKDSQFGFSFRYPASWTIAKQGGRMTTIGRVKTYVLDISIPRNSAQLSVTVDADVVPIPPFQNGHTAPDPNGPTHTFQYFHARVAGWPAMVIRRFTSKQITEVDTVTNTRTRSYDVRMLTATPPFSSDITAGYNHVVTSFTVPFS
jgi:hypothetical protein